MESKNNKNGNKLKKKLHEMADEMKHEVEEYHQEIENLPEASSEHTIKLDSDKKYTITTNGTVTNEGTFSLYKNVSNLEHLDRLYIDFSNYPDKMIINNDGVNLVWSDDANNGYTSTYKKK